MTPPMNTAPNNTMRGMDTPPDAPATALGMPANSGRLGRLLERQHPLSRK